MAFKYSAVLQQPVTWLIQNVYASSWVSMRAEEDLLAKKKKKKKNCFCSLEILTSLIQRSDYEQEKRIQRVRNSFWRQMMNFFFHPCFQGCEWSTTKDQLKTTADAGDHFENTEFCACPNLKPQRQQVATELLDTRRINRWKNCWWLAVWTRLEQGHLQTFNLTKGKWTCAVTQKLRRHGNISYISNGRLRFILLIP